MYLTCPSCDSRFEVAIDQLGPKGRRVRCGRCGHAWRARAVRGETPVPEGPPPESAPGSAPESPPQSAPEAETAATPGSTPGPTSDPAAVDPAARLEAFDEARRRSRALRPPPPQKPRRRGGVAGWIFFVAVVLGLAAGAVFGRQHVVAWLPATAELYAMAGLPVESVLEILDITSELRMLDGEEALVVAGRIFNPTGAPQSVPPIVATILDPDDAELKQWIIAADSERLPAGGSTTFETSTAVPPPQSRLNLDFSMDN